MPNSPYSQVQQLPINRWSRLRNELRFALARTDAVDLRELGGRAAGRLVRLIGQRVGALTQLAKFLGQG